MELKYRGAANGSTDARQHDVDDVTDPRALFKEIHKKAFSLGIQQHELARLQFINNFRQTKSKPLLRRFLELCLLVLVVVAACTVSWHLEWPLSKRKYAQMILLIQGNDLAQSMSNECLINARSYAQFRPILDCNFCRNVSEVDRLPHISPAEFENKYAYSGRPVVISDGALNWSAVEAFSFEFFRDIYGPGSPQAMSRCQFFRYEFTHVDDVWDVFSQYHSADHFTDGSHPLYIGWENCDATTGSYLRKFYSKPYFLPSHSESLQSDWVFMGSPGFGAKMHIDNVGYPSWQAQISSHKQWTLESPSECILECPASMTVTVHPGEIIVMDTNRWFHSTLIVGDQVSITIGSEYD